MSSNQLDQETSPYLLLHTDNPVHWRAWGAGRVRRSRGREQTDPSLGRLHGVPLVPCDEPRKLRRPRNGDADERAVRQHQGRPRRTPGHRPALSDRRQHHGPARAAGRSPCSSRPKANRFSPAPISRRKTASVSRLQARAAKRWRAFTANSPSRSPTQSRACSRRSPIYGHATRAAELNAMMLDLSAIHIAQRFDIFYGGMSGAPKFPSRGIDRTALARLSAHRRRRNSSNWCRPRSTICAWAASTIMSAAASRAMPPTNAG